MQNFHHVISDRTLGSSPRNCSGAQNAGVPTKDPRVIKSDAFRVDAEMDKPKSPTLIVPSALTKQLAGLTSRCKTSTDAAASSPAMICRIASTALGAGIGP